MKFRILALSFLVFTFAATLYGQENMKTISIDTLRDKIAGGWAGKMIGVSYGAPTEFRAQGKTYEEKLAWEKPSRVNNALRQDDLYVQLSLMMTMDQYGIDAPAAKFAESFATAGYPLWHANAQGRKNFFDGIMPPLSGSPEYNMHADDIDFQIEADYIGFINPGMPKTAMLLADKVGHIMNYGDGVYGGVFMSAMYTQAFFENDIQKIVKNALLSIPAKSDYAKCISDVLILKSRYPDDWRATWKKLEEKWGDDHICGALSPFNIDAKINGAYVVIGLLYGDGDFGKTMEIAIRCGQDSDCNPSNAAAVIGIMRGYSGVPNEWKDGIPAIADSLFIYTKYSFNSAVENTMKYAKQLITENGGKISANEAAIKIQKPVAAPFEVSFPRLVPDRVVAVSDSTAWTFKGNWKSASRNTITSESAGAEAVFTFTGTGVTLHGSWWKDGGKADVYVDGKLSRTIDTWFNQRGSYEIWETLKLKPGKHTARLVVKGEKRSESTGTSITLSGATVFKTGPKKSEGVKI
ncbi:MAG: ADP-ribosylglycohydrolase family protein [Candidatus Latescibacter sp.]|nr:ADP-ribosylglycohydrolase family protein [Candidatus Latescibacter sp.]